jgi:hypothetical protein
MENKWKFKGNTTNPSKPIWNEYVNTETGESTLQEHKPVNIMSAVGCDHHFERIDTSGNIQCRSCKVGMRIIAGLHELENGKVINLKVPEVIKKYLFK